VQEEQKDVKETEGQATASDQQWSKIGVRVKCWLGQECDKDVELCTFTVAIIFHPGNIHMPVALSLWSEIDDDTFLGIES
jgi:hypothetical protein